MKKLCLITTLVSSFSASAIDVTYECIIDGKRVIQDHYCPAETDEPEPEAGVYLDNSERSTGTLSDVLAAQAAARDSIANHGRNLSNYNRQLQREYWNERRYRYERGAAEDWRIRQGNAAQTGDRWGESFSRHRAEEHEENARQLGQ